MEAALRPNLRVVQEKTQNQLDLQACHRVRSRLVSRRTATINQIRAFLIEQGSGYAPDPERSATHVRDPEEPRGGDLTANGDIIVGLYEDWLWLDERIET